MALKVGLIGAGGFGTIHLLGYVRNPNCKLVAIASRTEEHARKAAERFGIPKIYGGVDSWKKMIENEELDVISICTQYRLIDHFINCIAEDKQESPNFEDGKRAVEFVLEAYSLKE